MLTELARVALLTATRVFSVVVGRCARSLVLTLVPFTRIRIIQLRAARGHEVLIGCLEEIFQLIIDVHSSDTT